MPPTEKISEFHVDAMLCDSAVTADGKLFLQGGGWTMLNVPALPTVLPRLGIGLVITVPYLATNQNHDLLIELKSEDGEPVLVGAPPNLADPAGAPGVGIGEPVKAEGQFNVGRPPILLPGEAQTLPFAINVDGLQISTAGGYVVMVSVDGTPLRNLHFRVISPTQQNIRVR
jgi:hypothetical protein